MRFLLIILMIPTFTPACEAAGGGRCPDEPRPSGAVPFFDAQLDRRGDLSAYTDMSNSRTGMVINPSKIQVVDDPVFGSRRKVVRLYVGIDDTAGVTNNPRAQLQTPMQYEEGQEVFAAFSTLFPPDFPDFLYWMTLAEFYGKPYRGTSPFLVGCQADKLILQYEGAVKWSEPVRKGVWYDHVYRTVLSKDEARGEIQVFQRVQGERPGWREILPTTRTATITASNLEGPQYHKICCYYSAVGNFADAAKTIPVERVRLWHANHRVGGTFEEVAPPYLEP